MPRFRGAVWFDFEAENAEAAQERAWQVAKNVENFEDDVHNGTAPNADDFRELDASEYTP